MTKSIKNSLLLAKVESSYGVDPTPTAADNSLEVIDLSVKPVFEKIDREIVFSSLSKKPSLRGIRYVEITFKAELHGSGTPGTAPRIGALLQACALAETTSGGSSVIYTPKSTNLSSVALYCYKDGLRHIVLGSYGSFKITGFVGKIATCEFKMQGVYASREDSANPSPTFDGVIPNPVVSAQFTWNSIADLVAQEFTLDYQGALSKRVSMNEATGVKGFYLGSRGPVFTIDPEAETVAKVDWEGDMLTNTRAMSLYLGTEAGKRCKVSIPEAMVTELEYDKRDDILIDKITGECSTTNGNSEFQLIFD